MSEPNHFGELFAQLQAVANSLADPIFVLDYDGRYVAVLGEGELSPGDSQQHLVGRTLQEVLPEEKGRLFLAVVQQAIDSGTLQLCEYQLDAAEAGGTHRNNPGGCQWFQGRAYPVKPRPGQRPTAVWLTINVSEQKQMEERLKKLSDIDDLTGVYNRRYFLRRIEREIEIARRRRQILSLIFLDADHFKKINDQYGHVQGDRVLQHLASIIGGHLRGRDIFARVGGEEFAVLCPTTSHEEALILAERLCHMVAAAPLETGQLRIPLTISLGVASLRDADQEVGHLLRRADLALYNAKHNGRNQACGTSANFRLRAEIA